MNNLPESPKEAKQRGVTIYLGKPCRKCGNEIRKTASRDCRECAKKKWRDYYYENTEKFREIAKIRYQENREYWSIRNKQYYDNNKDYFREKGSLWRKDNRNRHLKKLQECKRNRRAHHTAKQNERRARKTNATPVWANEEQINIIYWIAALCSKQTGRKYNVDHVIPLRGKNVCGLHVSENLRVIPARENLMKGNRVIDLELTEG